MNFFIRHLKVNRSGVAVMLAVQGAVFLFGVLLVIGINTFINDEKTYAAVGSMMALGGVFFGGLFRGGGGMNRYLRAVSMGQTRRSYILADPLITVINCALGIAFVCVLDKLEVWIYGVLYPGWTLEFDLFSELDFIKWWYAPVFIAGICILDFCLGALQLRFGTKGFAAIWFPLCFAPMVITNTVGATQRGSTNLLAQIGRFFLYLGGLLPAAAGGGVLAVFLLGLIVLSVLCYRTAEVRI